MVAIAHTTTPIGSCSRDPIGYEGDRNLFSYVRGKVYVLTDPSGLVCEPVLTSGRAGASPQNSFSKPGAFFGYHFKGFSEFGWVLKKDSLFSFSRSAVSSHIMPSVPSRGGGSNPSVGGVPAGYRSLETNVNCKVRCADSCDIMITCEDSPNGGGLEEWPEGQVLYGEGIVSSSAHKIQLNGTVGSVEIYLGATFMRKKAPYEFAWDLGGALEPFGVGGELSGGYTTVYSEDVEIHPENKNKEQKSFSWECKKCKTVSF